MTAFTFEYSRRGESPLIAETIDISNEAAIWCHVEALALRMGGTPGAFIRVRDEKGRPVVRTGVATALASIEKCACGTCPLKEAAARGEIPEGGAPKFSPCRSRGACACTSFKGN